VLGHALFVVGVAVQQLGGAPMGERALGARQLLVDAGAHERVHEGQRAPGLEDARRHEGVDRQARRAGLQARERRGAGQLGTLEHRERPRKALGGLGQAAHAQQDPAPCTARAGGRDAGRGASVGLDALRAQRLDELADQEGRAPGRAVAGLDEGRVGPGAQPRLDEPGDRRQAQRRGPHDVGRRVGGENGQGVGAVALDLGARGDDQRDRQLVQAREQEGKEAQRGGVGPVRVVQRQDERAARGEVRAQPVEAVQHGEGGVERHCRLAFGRRAGQPQHARRLPGGALEQLGALFGARLAQRGLEQLAHDPEGEVALELGSPRAQDAGGAVVGGGAGRGEHRRLADPRGPFDDHGGARTLARAGDGRLDARKLAVALEQVGGRGRRKYQSGRERTSGWIVSRATHCTLDAGLWTDSRPCTYAS
jgi:hypothetical protein